MQTERLKIKTTKKNCARLVLLYIGQQRSVLGITQQEAADRAGLDVRHWQKLEDGEVSPKLQTLIGVAMALRVHPGALFEACIL